MSLLTCLIACLLEESLFFTPLHSTPLHSTPLHFTDALSYFAWVGKERCFGPPFLRFEMMS